MRNAELIVADMRRVFGVGICVLTAVAISLSAILSPFLSFRQYAHHLPVIFSHSHIRNSLVSIRDAGIASLCLSPILSQLPVFCSWRTNASPTVNATLADLALVQYRMGEQLAQHGLTYSLNSALSIQRATDIAMAFDNIALLFERDNMGLHGAGHVQLLVDVNRASRSLWAALYRITLHMELGLRRLADIDKTVLAGMQRFIRCDHRREVVPVAPLLLNHLVNISSSATLDSIHHVQIEIATAKATFSVLLEALQRFAKDNRVHRQCTFPRARDICADISVLWNGDEHMQTVRNDLAKLTQIFDFAVQELSTIGTGNNTAPQRDVTEAHIGIDACKLGESMQKLVRSFRFVRQISFLSACARIGYLTLLALGEHDRLDVTGAA